MNKTTCPTCGTTYTERSKPMKLKQLGYIWLGMMVGSLISVAVAFLMWVL